MKLDKYVMLSSLAVLLALFDSVGAMLGFWSITRSDTRYYILAFEFATLGLMLLNSLLIKASVEGVPWRNVLAQGCLASLILCICGDVVNFNLSNHFFDSSNVVKHDYLIDSVLFFAPGYVMLLLVMGYIFKHYYSAQFLAKVTLLSFAVATLSYINMVNVEAELYIIVVTYFYSILITLIGASGILLWYMYGISAPLGIWLCSIGLVLATVADCVIGTMWIFGNDGQGFYPLARELNWVLYISSQSLVIHLPRVIELTCIKRLSNYQSIAGQ
ncbi:hypothetical protein [Pseudoalteromonas sp. MMG022]|uniref:hypothetical protein n=1 Tax=Pseudoalteromonas sp. MMG022 TaxID=2909978 RepID=UPI001F286E27|nr:hypothetical protein [Pseudoalteromonas sp. MMG022]MCF6434014.1 hypothetical protein [Pseudoalteromonas sp. MMG022]